MTPSSSSGPFAALVNTGSKSSISTDSPSGDRHPALNSDSDAFKKKAQFNQVFQQLSDTNLSEVEINTGLMPDGLRTADPSAVGLLGGPLGQQLPVQPPAIQWPVHVAGLSPTELAGELLPGQLANLPPGTQPELTPDLALVNGKPQTLSDMAGIAGTANLTGLDEMPSTEALVAASGSGAVLSPSLTGGVKSPVPGNPLPLGVLQNPLGQSADHLTTGAQSIPGILSAADLGDHTAVLQQGAFKAAPDATEVLTRPFVPESAAPFAWLLKPIQPAPVASNTSILPIVADAAATVDAEVNQAEALRTQAMSSPPERPPTTQAPIQTMSLSRVAGAPGWDQGLGQRILWMVDNGLRQAELRLDPPHLGSVNVRITMVDDQAQLAFQAQHPGAREALESALPKLREMFNQEGLELGDADISDERSADTGREAKGNESGSGSGEYGQADVNTVPNATSVDSSASEVRSGGSLLVDEFV
ncbi:MAG: flagellar hook-length control protein FliK [Gammaproteobacteria bacterium]